MSDKYLNPAGVQELKTYIDTKDATKQDTLVSGTNIKTVNNTSLLGNGNIDISGGVFVATYDETTLSELQSAITDGKTIIIRFSTTYYSLVFDYERDGYGNNVVLYSFGYSADTVYKYKIDSTGWSETRTKLINNTIILTYNSSTFTDCLNNAFSEDSNYNPPLVIIYEPTDSQADSTYLAVGAYATTIGGQTCVVFTAIRDSSIVMYKVFADDTWTKDVYNIPSQATDTVSGTIKLNPSESVTLNSDGQLDVGGRLGQMSNTTGVYSPKTINPAAVGNGSFLLTEGSGQRLGNKSLAVVTGSGLSLKTAAAAGATTYLVSNTYENRIICAGIVGGVLCLNEATAAENYVNVTSVTIGGYSPSSSSYWTASGDITIKTDASINPNSSVSSVRPYCTSGTGFSNLLVGQQSGGIGGASIVVGQKVYSASGNSCAVVGASIYNTGNGNALFGRQHISRKNRWLMAGTGHNNTNGRSESGVAVGQWSLIDSDEILFAVGDGTSDTARSNAFEVRDQAFVIKSPDGTRWKVAVSNTGTLTTTAIS